MATSSIAANSSANNGAASAATSTDVSAKVQKALAAANPGIAKLNATLTRDQTKLSALGQLQSALAGFQALAASLSGSGKTTVAVSQDPAQIGKNVKAFVAAYNDLNQKLQALQKGGLKSDTALNQVSSQLSQLLKTGGAGVSVSALANAGVALDASGNLKLDDKKLTAALAADSAAVGKLFTNDGKGIADQLAAKAGAFTTSGSVVGHEAASLIKEITSVNAKRNQLSQTLTAQASALAALYSQQAQSGTGGGTFGSGATSLFDMLA